MIDQNLRHATPSAVRYAQCRGKAAPLTPGVARRGLRVAAFNRPRTAATGAPCGRKPGARVGFIRTSTRASTRPRPNYRLSGSLKGTALRRAEAGAKPRGCALDELGNYTEAEPGFCSSRLRKFALPNAVLRRHRTTMCVICTCGWRPNSGPVASPLRTRRSGVVRGHETSAQTPGTGKYARCR